jgi:hypothetical protein
MHGLLHLLTVVAGSLRRCPWPAEWVLGVKLSNHQPAISGQMATQMTHTGPRSLMPTTDRLHSSFDTR